MRILRSIVLLLGVAIVTAGCAQQSAGYFAYPTAGIDNVVYGMGATYAPAVAAGGYRGYGGYAAAPAVGGYGGYAASPYGGGMYAYAAPQLGPANYTLDSGDRLRVVVFGQDGLTNSYAVDAGGNIDMPLIGGVGARGLTTEQLSARIADKLRDGYVREPHVAVEIEAYRPFFILGEVTQPGQYPYVANMTAETAVAIAGGFTARALRKSVMLDRNYYGRQVRIGVPLTFPLRPGDTINVQERWF
jgi:polysaccharide biosynthesis/export protein